jgi:hypothetical protein
MIDTANWLAAIGTVGAFAVSLRLLALDLAARRVAQASLVAAWLAGDPVTWGTNPRVRVSNQSDQPVYDLKVFLELTDGERSLVHQSSAVPSRKGSPKVFYEPEAIRNPQPGTECRGVTVEFTDAGGRRWRRGLTGRLHHITK